MVIACFANGVLLGRAYYRRSELAAAGLVVRASRGVGLAAQRGRLADDAARGGRGRRVVEVKRRSGRSDERHGEQHHRSVLPRLLHVHGSRGGRCGRSTDPVTSSRRRRGRRRRRRL